MALFKSKNSRRSSSSPYTSTLTILVFLALCALAIWMLSSNSVISPDQATNTHVAVDNSELTNNDLSAAVVEDSGETTSRVTEEPVDTTSRISDESGDSSTTIPDPKETQTFGDNPGQLPEDAIKSDDKNPNLNVNNDHISTGEAQISEESSLTQTQQASETISDKKPEEIHEEPETVSVKENQQQSITERPQEDAQTFESQEPKKDMIDEQLQQLREDKGETVEKDQTTQQPKQDENPDSTAETSQQEPQLAQNDQSSNLSQEDPKKKKTQKIEEESEETQKPKTEKKRKRKALPKEAKKSWSTQADESKKEKEGQTQARTWELCNVTAGTDYIPCLDNEAVVSKLHSRKHFEHRERHCPEEAPTCLVPRPPGYKRSIEWSDSRNKVTMNEKLILEEMGNLFPYTL